MDMGAHLVIDTLYDYVVSNYGTPPRIRGIRFMKLETPVTPLCKGDRVFNSFCGKDVIYIHTRCGYGRWDEEEPNTNYTGFKADKWELSNPDTFIKHVNSEFDCTYMDHYFKAVVNDDYNRLIKLLLDGEDVEGDY